MRESFLVETREQSARESARKRAERIARKAAPKPAPKQATKAPGPISAVSFGAPLPAGYVENERSPRVAFIRSGFISKSDAHAVNTLRQRGVALRVVVGEQVFSDGIVSIPASRTDDFFAFVDTKAVGSNPRLLSTMRPAPRGFVPAPVLGGAL
jgi:hypothetical protein